MNEDEWQLHLNNLHETERKRIIKMEEDIAIQHRANEYERKYNEYLKLKKEFEYTEDPIKD